MHFQVDAIRHKHVLLEITESILESTHSWMVEEGRRREQRMKMSPELRNESGATADVYCGPTHEQGALPAAAVESFGKVFMSSALTGDGVQDLRVMQWSKSTNSLFSPEIKFIVNGGWD